MKIKTVDMSFDSVSALPKSKKFVPKKPNLFFRTLLKVASLPDLKATNFSYKSYGMQKLGKNEPCLILMNHSSFIDLKIASYIFYPRPMNIVCTNDGFVGKSGLMRNLGCIPTKKFETDATLVRNMLYAVRKLKTSILMYPEASYSFDGTATPLPDTIGKFIKMLSVPVVFVRTYGAFARDPLYNNLQLRKVSVSAEVKYLLSKDDIESNSVYQINEILKSAFTFDNFRWQKENGVKISEPFRADGLHRVLYRCPNCDTEGKMTGSGVHLKCGCCGKKYLLDEYGEMSAENGTTEFSHIPDWYKFERECVRQEILSEKYRFECDVDIKMLVDFKSIYSVGTGRLTHDCNGFHLVGCDGKIDFVSKPSEHYGLYADYFWYEIGDVICISNGSAQYYCFPRDKSANVAKVRLATEELYKISKTAKDAVTK